MNIREFLRPEWRKLILPAVFIILFLVLISIFYSFVPVQNEYGCDYALVIREMNSYYDENRTDEATIEQIEIKYRALRDKMFGGLDLGGYFPIYITILTLDPFIPLPCEYPEYTAFSLTKYFCEHYFNKETFNCYYNTTPSIFGIDEQKAALSMGYKGPSFTSVVINILILFIEGYLISSVILLLLPYRKRKISIKPDSVKSFLKPSGSKIITFILIILILVPFISTPTDNPFCFDNRLCSPVLLLLSFAAYNGKISFVGGHVSTPILILGTVISYIVSCIIVLLIEKIRKDKNDTTENNLPQ